MSKLVLPRKNFKENFKQISEVGSGTYGKVYKVASAQNEHKLWAFKKITYSKDSEGFPQTALREIKILKSLDHKNVVKLHDIFTSKPSENNKFKGSTFLVFDYMEHDLWGLMKEGAKFTTSHIKCIMKQLFEGLNYIHTKNILHRDIKSANILLNNKGEVQIADFGLARTQNSISGHYTSCVVTLWYRAPELLLGTKKYTTQVDIWSMGCVMAELILGVPLFNGDKEPKQCELIFQICGTPDEANWPGCKNLQFYSTFVPGNVMDHHPRVLKDYLLKHRPFLDQITLDFIDRLLTLNPDKRMTAKEALEHEFFTSAPFPCKPIELELSKYQDCHVTLMNIDKRRKDANRNGDDTNNKKRRFSEFDKKVKPPAPYSHAQEKQYSFKSPERSETITNITRSQSYVSQSEQKIDAPNMPQMEVETSKTYERFSTFSALFTSSTQPFTSEKKTTGGGDYLSSLLQSGGSNNNRDEYKSNSYKKVHM